MEDMGRFWNQAAEKLAALLARLGLFPPGKVLYIGGSGTLPVPLTRAAESAALLFPRARLVPVEGLQEMHFGAFEGRSAQEMEDDPAYRAWVEGDCLGRCPGGESRAAFSDRCCAAFSRLVDEELRKGSPRMAVVAHGGTQMAVLERFGAPGRAYYAWCAPNGGGYVLRADRWASERTLDLVQEVCFAEGSPWKS